MSYDLVIRNGLVVDGTGRAPYPADVALSGDHIAAVGDVPGRGKREIDARDRVVTPGFVDIHTHLDAQIMWDPQVTSPCWHGVTSVILGNCGMSFAPARPDEHEFLVKLMESVEDIPAESILAGSPFKGGSYGDFLDLLDRVPKGVNAGGLVGHCAIRYHTMGERSMDETPASEQDVAQMCRLVDSAMHSGALGFSTSRTLLHTTPDGRQVPGTFARPEELRAIGRVVARSHGLFEAVHCVESPDPEMHRSEIDWMAQLSRESQLPLTFALIQNRQAPTLYRESLAQVAEANRQGARLRPQTQVRSVGVVVGLPNLTPFDQSLAWNALKELTLPEKLQALRDPARRSELVRQGNEVAGEAQLSMIYAIDDDARYDFEPEQSLWQIARRRGVSAAEAFIELSLEREGQAYFVFPFMNHEMDAVGELLADPHMVLGLADSGAHCGQICDSSFSTYFLQYWVRERKQFTLEEAIRKLTSEPAELFGLRNRGMIREGACADLNILDLDALRVHPPEYRNDFPAGAGRLVQRGSGYDYTIVNGQVFMQGGEPTGALAGRLLRGDGVA